MWRSSRCASKNTADSQDEENEEQAALTESSETTDQSKVVQLTVGQSDS